MAALQTRPCGKTGEKITVLGLGRACLDEHSFREGVATVRHALEMGVTYFDTSPYYGESQAILLTKSKNPILSPVSSDLLRSVV